MTTRGSRLARGWAGAGFATTIAAGSHMAAGGDAPNLLLLLFSLAVSGLVCCLLAGRQLSLSRLIAGVLASQAVFHSLFSMPLDASSGTVMSMTGMQHGGMVPSAISAHQGVSPLGHSGGDAWQMWVAHGVAAVLTIVFLHYGEGSFFRLIEALRLKITAVLRLSARPVPAPSRLQPCSSSILLPPPNIGVPLPVKHHRGPPLPAAAFQPSSSGRGLRPLRRPTCQSAVQRIPQPCPTAAHPGLHTVRAASLRHRTGQRA